MRLSKPEEDPEVEPEPVTEEGESAESVVVIGGTEMPISEAVEKLDEDLTGVSRLVDSGRQRLDEQEEMVEELQGEVDDLGQVVYLISEAADGVDEQGVKEMLEQRR